MIICVSVLAILIGLSYNSEERKLNRKNIEARDNNYQYDEIFKDLVNEVTSKIQGIPDNSFLSYGYSTKDYPRDSDKYGLIAENMMVQI